MGSIASKAYRIHGVTPSILNFVLSRSETISHFRDCLDTYYLKYWSGKYLIQEIKEGVIKADNRIYHIVFQKPLSRGQILLNHPNQQYKLSFRAAMEDFNLPAFVFISES